MSQNQHYVPKVYLKRFINYNKKLYTIKNTIDELPAKISEFSPKATGYQKDFYKIVDDNQLIRFGITDRNIIEGLFSGQLESNCSKIIDRVTKHSGSVNVNDAVKMIYLILSFKQRNPSMRQGFANKELIRSTFFNRIDEVISQRDTIEPLLMKHDGKTFEEFMETLKRRGEEFVNSPNTPINTHTEGLLNFFSGESDVIHEVASILFSMKWSVYQSPPSCPFITSDNPGFCMDSSGMVNSVAFGDIILFGFPLDPKNCLILTRSQSESKKAVEYIDCTIEAANAINLSTLTTSYKYVYSNDENTLVKTWRMKQQRLRDSNAQFT